MFGVVASGKLVNTNVQEAGVNEYFLTLEDALSVNHIVVFLTGQIPFSEGFGGSIYLGWPAEGGGMSWQLLGFISNSKPSAIFKITKVKPSETVTPFGQEMMATVGHHSTAMVGLRVEPLDQLAQETPASGTQASSLSNMSEFSQKMLENLFNFASSYAVDPTRSALTPGETYIPAAALRQWYSNFQRRLSLNPNFWKTL